MLRLMLLNRSFKFRPFAHLHMCVDLKGGEESGRWHIKAAVEERAGVTN